MQIDYEQHSVPRELATLSALIDEGRLYFKNAIIGDGYGSTRYPAFQGYRPKILDPLVACYDATTKIATESDIPFLLKAFREADEDFVSLLQAEIGRVFAYDATAASAGDGGPIFKYKRVARARMR